MKTTWKGTDNDVAVHENIFAAIPYVTGPFVSHKLEEIKMKYQIADVDDKQQIDALK